MLALPLSVVYLFALSYTIQRVSIVVIAINDEYSRIVGGTVTDIASVPYLVNIRVSDAFICGGSLVTTLHVITAAHCVKGVPSASISITGGATYLTDAGVRRTVTKVLTPKAYNTRTLHLDVAVLKLSSSMSGTNIGVIDLCDSNWKVGDTVKVSGWGQTTARSASGPSRRVRTVEVALIARANCALQYKTRGTITTSMFCASVPGVRDSCEGDSGGPAVYRGQLCGIVSWGIGCAQRKYPGVYTNIKTVKPFLDKALRM